MDQAVLNRTDRQELRTTFDDLPETYDRTRPVCPPQVFDDLAVLGGLREAARIVEIGPGTGQATLPLAERGYEVTAVELGDRLAAFARRKLARFPNVEVVSSSFEEWEAGDARFDAVASFNAFHWIDPEVRYAKPAQLLRDGGVLAVVASHYVVPDDADPFWIEVQEDYEAIGPTADVVGLPIGDNRAPPHPDQVGDLSDEVDASGHFHNAAVRRYLWTVCFTAAEYIDLLRTSSWHRALDQGARRMLFERIHQRIEAQPDRCVRPTLLATLNVARAGTPTLT
jgi:SAM-dependent methyltransferase